MFPSAEGKEQEKTSSHEAQNFTVSSPTVQLPKGGGAIRGMGEKFAANPVTGTGSMTVPIATSPGRSGFGPQLSLSYDSGAGNGPFGLGWSLSLPAITRKTDKGLPRYFDGGKDQPDADVFILSGAEDLVPVLSKDPSGNWNLHDISSPDGEYVIRRYQPRIEGLFARIERWTRSDGDVHWRSISKENILTLYGKDENSRICDPDNVQHIFRWLICETRDDKGNAIVYTYKAEDGQGIDLAQAHEQNRGESSSTRRNVNRYVKRIQYGNRITLLDDAGNRPHFVMQDALEKADWMFDVVFDYGEGYDADVPSHTDHCQYLESKPDADGHIFAQANMTLPANARYWTVRQDPFSSYRAGFEVRTSRLCRRVLMFHHFPQELGLNDYLVRSTEFSYAENPVASFIMGVTQSGYLFQPTQDQPNRYLKKSLPPVEFAYSQVPLPNEFAELPIQEIDAESLENLPIGLDGASYQWMDLDGEGTSGILTEQANGWFYKRNLSANHQVKENGKTHTVARFGPMEVVVSKPAAGLGSGAQFLDLAGDGQIDLVQMQGSVRGFYERTEHADWEPFQAFSSWPNVNTRDPNVKFVDLTGDGHADILISDDTVFQWHASLAEEGFGPAERVYQSLDEEKGPRLVFADGTESIYLADMSGDGLTDLVRIRNGDVCYWPNLGYGRFGAKVTMDDAPWFDMLDQFHQRRIRLVDIDGSGTTDILYLHRDGVYIYFNQGGNRWSDAIELRQFPAVNDLTSVQALDLLGNGTGCLVWSSALPGDVRRPLRYIALMDEKPHLLIGVKNNLGAETTIEYAPSTKFYLDDKQNGNPWITRLPFPVHCVRRVSVYDKWREATFTTTYRYHHGHFDGVEREFRGFGRVDQIDSEDYGQFSVGNPGSPYITHDQKLYQPPIKTVTWFHTGIFIDEKSILSHYSDEYWPRWFEALSPDTPDVLGGFQENALPEPDFADIDLTSDEWRQALRACKGMPLRQEIYELDVKALERGEEIPVKLFSTAYHNCHIDRLQLQGINQHAVFLVIESEAITYHYELDLRSAQVKPDPRVAHTLNLTIDSMGHVLQAIAVAYPRFNTAPDSTLPQVAQQLAAAVQNELHVAYTEAFFTDDIDEADSSGNYRLRLPCEVQTYELTGIRPDDAEDHITPDPHDNVYFTIDEFRKFRLSERYQPAHEYPDLTEVHALAYHEIATAGPEKRLIEHAITLYFDEAGSATPPTPPLTTPMPFGHHGPRGLKYEDYKLALTINLLNRAFNRGTDDFLADELETGRTARNILNEPRTQGSPYLKSGYIPGQAVRESFTDQYWIRSGTAGFASDAPQHFFLPKLYRDPFGNDTTLTYHEPDYLFIQASTDARGNTTQVDAFDFRMLAPREMVDMNANHTEVIFDILGRVAAMAVKGKGNEADDLSGYSDDFCNPSLAEVKNLFELPSLSTEDTRQRLSPMVLDATTRFLYHFGEEIQNGETVWATRPAGACAIQREIHAAQPNGANSPLQIALECSDGSGSVLMKKVQAEPDPESHDPKPPLRWIVNGLTVLNNKGKPVKRYEPAFSERFGCETPQANGVTPIMYYDAPGRLIRTEFPDGTLSRVEFSPWYVKTFDQNDTVWESRWYRERLTAVERGADLESADGSEEAKANAAPADEKRAAWLATHHADTPALTVLDSLGREVISVAHNRTPDESGVWQDAYYLTYTKLDAEGKPLWIRDALGHLVMQYITPSKTNNEPSDAIPVGAVPCYDIAGNLLFQHSMDAGDRWMLMDAAGKPMLAWDFNERQQNNNLIEEKRLYFTEYDALHRPTAQWLRIDSDPRQMVERFEYRDTIQLDGTPNPNVAQDQAANLIGQAVFHYDASGRVELVKRDFKGNVLDVKRRLNNQPTQSMVNWGSNPESFLENEDETFVQHTEYDALNRMVRLENWHLQGSTGAIYTPTYSERGLLIRETIAIRGNATTAIKAIHYNAKGQKEFLELGNDTLTQYDYDPKTFRLKQIRTTRPTDPANFPALRSNLSNPNIVQQLLYTYDPVGNITEVEDQAYKPVFFDNGIAEPKSLYAYDALYRLIHASGRETAVGGDAARDAKEPAYGKGFPITDQTLRRYTESYDYDPVGNILTLQHSISNDPTNSWTRHYQYAFDNLAQLPASNRLWQTWTGGDRLHATTYQHDTHGNMLNLANTTPNFYMRWNHRDMIASINLGAGDTAYYQYDAGKQRTRKRITNQNNLGGYWERIYLSGYELYRRYNGNSTTPVEEIESHHLFEGEQRILLVDDVIKASDAAHPRPDGLRVPGQTLFRYEYSNHLGSACLELDHQAEIISYEEYHPYGTSAYRAMKSGIEVPPKRYRYTGMERDEESGLGYHVARYYVVWLGRWTSVDPILLLTSYVRKKRVRTEQSPHEPNLAYCYVKDNPCQLIDPEGTQEEPDQFVEEAKKAHGALARGTKEVFETAAPMAEAIASFNPLIAASEGYSGETSLTKTKLAWWERTINLIPADKVVHLLGSMMVFKKFKSLYKDEEILEVIVDAEKLGGHATDEVRAAERIEEAGGQIVSKEEGGIKGFFKRTWEVVASRAHARSLAKSLEEVGEHALPGHQPHHIVAWNDKRAERAREILLKAGVDIDSALNGVWLPNRVGDKTFDAFTRHRWVHNDAYYEKLTERLEAVAGDAEAVKSTLTEIKAALANLAFTYNKKGSGFKGVGF